MNRNERYFSLLTYSPQVTVRKALVFLMSGYFWPIIQMPEARHIWAWTRCRCSPAQVRQLTYLFSRLDRWCEALCEAQALWAMHGEEQAAQKGKLCNLAPLEVLALTSWNHREWACAPTSARPLPLSCTFKMQTLGMRPLTQKVTDISSSPSSVQKDPNCYPQEGNQTQGAPELWPVFQLNFCLF